MTSQHHTVSKGQSWGLNSGLSELMSPKPGTLRVSLDTLLLIAL